MWQDKVKNFSAKEQGFYCNCGCGKGFNDMHPDFMIRLDSARRISGTSYVINSGYRCPEYNNKVSSTGYDGPHTTGRAVDVKCENSRDRFLVLMGAIKAGFNRIGIHERFIHLDDTDRADNPNDRNVTWLY